MKQISTIKICLFTLLGISSLWIVPFICGAIVFYFSLSNFRIQFPERKNEVTTCILQIQEYYELNNRWPSAVEVEIFALPEHWEYYDPENSPTLKPQLVLYGQYHSSLKYEFHEKTEEGCWRFFMEGNEIQIK